VAWTVKDLVSPQGTFRGMGAGLVSRCQYFVLYVASNFSASTRRKKQPARFSASKLRKKEEDKEEKKNISMALYYPDCQSPPPCNMLTQSQPISAQGLVPFRRCCTAIVKFPKSCSLTELKLGTGRSKEVDGLCWRHVASALAVL
jgi:hypothetical protein